MTYTITGSHPFSWGHTCLSCRIFQYNELLRPLWLQIMILWITIYMSFVGNIVLPKVLNFCSNCKLPLTQPHPSDWKSWLLFSKKNKTENPSKDALDRTENYAKCKLCQLWSDWPGWLHDRDDQTNRSDQTDWGDQTEQGDQTDQCDPGDQTEQTEQVDQTDQTNIPTG